MSNLNGASRESVATWTAPAWASRTIEEDGLLFYERPSSVHVTRGLGVDATPVLRASDLPEIDCGVIRVDRCEPEVIVPCEGGELAFTTEQARALVAAVAELADLAEQPAGQPAGQLAQVMAFGGASA